MTNFITVLAQTAEPATGAGNPLQSLLLPLAFVLIFYFLIIRPGQKQKKEHAQRITDMKKGDKVITNGGIHGVVNHKSDTTVSLKVSEGVFITIESANISTVSSSSSEKVEEKK